VQTASGGGGLFGWLFGGARGGGADDDEEGGAAVALGGRGGPGVQVASGRGGFTASAAPAALAPAPPHRPTDLAPGDGAKGDPDVIASLIERDALPGAIVKGLRKTPDSALAMTEVKPAKPGPSPDALTRAASLAAPLPPPRPRNAASDGVSEVQKAPPLPPPRPNRNLRPSAANPFGSLVVDAFATPAPNP
jgi:hypothetical protein